MKEFILLVIMLGCAASVLAYSSICMSGKGYDEEKSLDTRIQSKDSVNEDDNC